VLDEDCVVFTVLSKGRSTHTAHAQAREHSTGPILRHRQMLGVFGIHFGDSVVEKEDAATLARWRLRRGSGGEGLCERKRNDGDQVEIEYARSRAAARVESY
jgi:hypothetical protein